MPAIPLSVLVDLFDLPATNKSQIMSFERLGNPAKSEPLTSFSGKLAFPGGICAELQVGHYAQESTSCVTFSDGDRELVWSWSNCHRFEWLDSAGVTQAVNTSPFAVVENWFPADEFLAAIEAERLPKHHFGHAARFHAFLESVFV
jgi:hypothetical protein